MVTLNPYLTFNGNCREAMEYYQSILGGELTVIVVKDSPVAAQMPPHYQDQLLHAHLKTDKLDLMASDMQPEKLVIGNDVHQCLVCKNEADAHALFDQLSAGGKVKQPLSPMFFGLIGSLTDKFGKHWLVECDK